MTDQIGPYRISRNLGRGGMGIVDEAVHPQTGQVVALKRAITDAAQEQVGLRREIHTLSRLSHPGIVRIVDSGVENAVPWYAMTFLEGGTLADYIRQIHGQTTPLTPTNSTLDLDGVDLRPASGPPLSSMPPPAPMPPPSLLERPRQLRIARRLMATLTYLHASGVVHRDLKPDNIFLLSGDAPVLVDFGLSHAGATGAARETFEDRPLGIGTPGYMAPEVIDGELPDARADIYAAGCVLFELFSGEPPFPLHSASLRQILHSHRSTPPPSLGTWAPDLPASLVALVDRMLAKDPRQRLSHTIDAVDLLERLDPPPVGDVYAPLRNGVQIYRPRLAGRHSPLAVLQTQIRTVRDRRGGFTIVSGPSGIGKTHLVNEAVRQTARRITTIPGRCAPLGPFQRRAGGTPLLPLRELFERLADACASDEALCRSLLGDRGPLLSPFSPRLLTLPESAQWAVLPALENNAQRERLITAIRDTLLAFAQQFPTLLLVDDLQWADELTLTLLERLASTDLTTTPLRVVATCRSEEMSPSLLAFLARPMVTHLSLSQLSTVDITEIVSDMMGTPEPPAALVSLLTAQSGGSPFFVAEYLRAANALGLLHRTAEGGLLLDRHADQTLPTTLEPLVNRRLQVLSPDALLLVQLASVMGRFFDEQVVSRASELPAERLDEAFHELLRQQVMEQNPAGPLHLAHDKIAEIAYASLSPEARQDLHRRIAAAATTHYAADLRPHHGALAHHHEQAGDLLLAQHHLQAEARTAFELLAYERTILAATHLLTLGHETLPAAEQAFWEQMLGESHWSLGDMSRCEEHTLRAFDLLGAHLPTTTTGWLLRILREAATQGLHLLGFGVGTITDHDRRETLARLTRASNTLCWRYLFADKIPHILALSLASVNWVEQAHPRIQSATAYGWLGFNVGSLRLHALASRYFARAHQDALTTSSLPDTVFALLMEGLYKAGFGRMEDELAISLRALEMLAGKGDPQNEELHLTMVGNISFYQGNFDISIQHFERILDSARARNNPQHTAWGLYAACWGLTARGDFRVALSRLEEAHALLEQNADLPSEIITHALLALCRLRTHALDAALQHVYACAERIDRTKVANYPTPHAYGLCADVALQILDRRPHDHALRRLCIRLVRDTGRLTWLLPYSACVARRVKGLLLTRQGQPQRAIITLRRAADAADALDMRYEAALSWWALAHHHSRAVPDAIGEARQRLTALGCLWHLSRLPD